MAIVNFDELETAQLVSPMPLASVTATEHETAVITNPEPIITPFYDVREALAVQDYAYPGAATVWDVVETAAVGDSYQAHALVVFDTTEEALIADTAFYEYPDVTITEQAVLADATYYDGVDRELDVLETAALADYVHLGLEESVRETAILSDAVSSVGSHDVIETAVITSGASFQEDKSEDVRETAVVLGSVSASLEANEYTREVAYISSSVYPSEAEERNYIFTANTVNWAMSVHTGLEHTGRAGRYAVAATGLYIEATGFADGVIDLGYQSLGSPQRKVVRSAYTHSRHDKPLSIEVTADVKGKTAARKYDAPNAANDADRSVRTSFGKGFRSTYFKFKITSRGFAVIRKVVPEAKPLSRKI